MTVRPPDRREPVDGLRGAQETVQPQHAQRAGPRPHKGKTHRARHRHVDTLHHGRAQHRRTTTTHAVNPHMSALRAKPAAQPTRAAQKPDVVVHPPVTRAPPQPTPSAVTTPATVTPASTPRAANAAEVVTNLKKAGFTCTPSGAGATRCRGVVPGHPLPVNIFVPKNFDPKAPLDLALHLHGHLLGSTAENAVFKRFDFGAMADKAGFRGLTVVPESADKDATFNRWVSNPATFTGMMRGVQSKLDTAGVTPNVRSIALSGHSGAYVAIGGLLTSRPEPMNKVTAVGLFDSSYGSKDQLAAGADSVVRRGGLFMSVNIANSGTSAVADAISTRVTGRDSTSIGGRRAMPELPSRGGVFYNEPNNGEAGHHWNVYARRFPDFLGAFARRNP